MWLWMINLPQNQLDKKSIWLLINVKTNIGPIWDFQMAFSDMWMTQPQVPGQFSNVNIDRQVT